MCLLVWSSAKPCPPTYLPLPAPLLLAPSRQVETQRFNATYSRKDERTPLVDFLLLAAAKAKAIYSQAYAELTRQVRTARRHRPTQGAGAGTGLPRRIFVARLSTLPAAIACHPRACDRAAPPLPQVTQQCEERGRLMADVWIGYAAMLDK